MHRIVAETWINAPLEETWNFFSDPKNLLKLTPAEMKMRVKGEIPDKMYAGMTISYTVSPLFGIPLSWTSKINQVVEGHYFTDDMIEGPFAVWHHQHFFEEQGGGTLVKDIVDYKAPLGILGRLVQPILVKPRVEDIFKHRESIIKQIF